MAIVCPIHVLKGRVRFRVEGLRGWDTFARELEHRLLKQPGVLSVKANPTTGNLLVHFESGLSQERIRRRVERAATAFLERPSPVREIEDTQLARHRAACATRSEPGETPHVLETKEKPWHTMQLSAVLRELSGAGLTGLSQTAAQESLQRYGPNVYPQWRARSGISALVDQFASFPEGILLVTAALAMVTGGLAEGLVGLVVLAVNGWIGWRAERNAARTMLSVSHDTRPQALVIRSGEPFYVLEQEVVPGDLMLLHPGVLVPADGRVVAADRLTMDESGLTGESVPVRKTYKPLSSENVPLVERINMVYRGTLVIGGTGLAVVTATGRFTEMGKLQSLMGDVLPPDPAVARPIGSMGREMAKAGVTALGLFWLASVLRSHGLSHLLRGSLALVGAALPAGLATVAISSLALGIRDLKKHGVTVRRLRALGNLPLVQTVCFDKTGTLTLNRMAVAEIRTAGQTYYLKDGQFFPSAEELQLSSQPDLIQLMRIGVLCNETRITEQEGPGGLQGSSTETCLVDLAIRSGIHVNSLREEYPMTVVYPHSEERPYMVSLHASPYGGSLVGMKGDPMEVLEKCARFSLNGEVFPLEEEHRRAVEAQNAIMADRGLKVLGVAWTMSDGPPAMDEVEAPRDLIWLGLIGLADPLREGAKELVATLHNWGVETTIITGDQTLTAQAIARELDIAAGVPPQILDAAHFTRMDPEKLQALVGRVHVFARVSPSQKFQIIQAYQGAGRVVAMTGDGVNDALALRVADVGIALGASGKLEAKEAADLLLEEDDLRDILVAFRDSRAIQANMRDSLKYLLVSKRSEIILMIAAAAAGTGFRMSALDAVFSNLACLALARSTPENRRSGDDRQPIHLGGPEELQAITREARVIAASALAAGACGVLRYGLVSRASLLAAHTLSIAHILHAVRCGRQDGSEHFTFTRPLDPLLKGTLWVWGAVQALSMAGFWGYSPMAWLDALLVGACALLPGILASKHRRARGRPVARSRKGDASRALIV